MGSPSAQHALERALERCSQVDDKQSFLMVARGFPGSYFVQGKLPQAQTLAEQHQETIGAFLYCPLVQGN